MRAPRVKSKGEPATSVTYPVGRWSSNGVYLLQYSVADLAYLIASGLTGQTGVLSGSDPSAVLPASQLPRQPRRGQPRRWLLPSHPVRLPSPPAARACPAGSSEWRQEAGRSGGAMPRPLCLEVGGGARVLSPACLERAGEFGLAAEACL